MEKRRSPVTGILAAAAMAAMILDTKTAMLGAGAGVELCMKTVIPSLFPFLILSVLLTDCLSGTTIRIFRVLGNRCGIPAGAESILVAGFLGGYPVGAQCVCQGYASGRLGRHDAQRMLGFCSNAGPAFLFGMLASQFSSRFAPFVLWGIHILSAILVGFLLPGKQQSKSKIPAEKQLSIGQAMQESVRIMAGICGWVVLFRVIITFLERWFFWLLDKEEFVLLSGILELANGCMNLQILGGEGARFVAASFFLGFGGLCVALQTFSVTARAGLNIGSYFPGKILQAIISSLLAWPSALLLYPETAVDIRFAVLPLIAGGIVLAFLKKEKLTVAFQHFLVYNQEKVLKGGRSHALP